MASMFVEEIQPVNPPLKITLELSLQEAAVIRAALHCMDTQNEVGIVVDNLERKLASNRRVKNYSQLLMEAIVGSKEPSKRVNLTHIRFPVEE